MLLLEVPLAKSSASIRAVFSPLVVASKAQPAPVAPPPIITISKESLCRDLICSSRDGRGLLALRGARSAWALIGH